MSAQSELREAAQDVLRQLPDYGNARIVAQAVLAEHPADADEPITPEWLASVGFKPYGVFQDGYAGHDGGYSRGPLDISHTNYVRFGGESIPLKTRGNVRLLCRALGIELREGS